MTRTRTIQIIAAVAVVVALLVGGFFVYRSEWNQERMFLAHVATRSADEQAGMQQLMQSAREWEAKIETATNAVPYAEAARYWKSIGDVFNLEYPRHRAISLYEAALDQFGDNATVYAAIGDTYKALELYTEAEEQYQRAITVEPGQFTHYLKLATLYRYRMQVPPQQVLAVYATALERLVIGSPDIYKDRALYYESLGSYAAAAEDWKAVMQLEPTNPGAKGEYERLRALVQEKK